MHKTLEEDLSYTLRQTLYVTFLYLSLCTCRNGELCKVSHGCWNKGRQTVLTCRETTILLNSYSYVLDKLLFFSLQTLTSGTGYYDVRMKESLTKDRKLIIRHIESGESRTFLQFFQQY